MAVEAKGYAGKIPVYCSYDEIVCIDDINKNPKNPNRHPEYQIEMLAKIIQGQGWRQPIKVSKRSGFIVSGHGRYEAALFMGEESVPVDYQEYGSEEEELADLLADNRIAELAEMDKQQLQEIFSEIDAESIDIELTGYTDSALRELFSDIDPETEEEDEEEPVIDSDDFTYKEQYGVIVMCADESEQEAVYNALIQQGYNCKVVAT